MTITSHNSQKISKTRRISKLSTKLILVLVLSSLIPLLIYGIISIKVSRSAYFQSIAERNRWVAMSTAYQIESYIKHNLAILQGLANNIDRVYLNKWQKEIIIKNFFINFNEFREISLLDHQGLEVATSRLEGEKLRNRSQEEFFQKAIRGSVYLSKIFISNTLLPSMIIAIPLRSVGTIDGVLVGELDLSDMWELIDKIRIGTHGIVFVVSQSGLLIAHGDDEQKPDIFKHKNLAQLEIVKSTIQGKTATLTYTNDVGINVLGSGYPVKPLGWGVVAEQPTDEAFVLASRMSLTLSVLTILFLAIMITLGIIGGRQVTRPIYELIELTRAIASGNLSRSANVSSGDEFEELANSFNLMTLRLAELQEEIRLSERSSIFARLAAGLVHDLKHPIKNIENSSHLILRLYHDPEYRQFFQKTVQKEFSNINRFLEDLHDLTHSAPVVPIELNAEAFLMEMINLYRDETSQKGIELQFICKACGVRILADKFLLERIIKNLITNAIEAMPKGGLLQITLSRDDDQAELRPKMAKIIIEDTGVGIPKERLETLFTDYITTKKRGLGLGLAITKKNVLELGGTITVESELGKGTIFTLAFPLVSETKEQKEIS
ncbi:MAG: HAMP domain-containing protein [bacterium]|nr:HAMP domain-containing protein [bacterium]